MEKCFAEKKRGCGAVIGGRNCEGCPFYKTEEQQKASLEKAYERMRSLSAEMQRYYANLYHNGQMPWLKEKGISFYEKADGYADPTAGEALAKVERKHQKKRPPRAVQREKQKVNRLKGRFGRS